MNYSQDATSPSYSFTEMAKYDTIPQYELPFGDKISMMRDLLNMEDEDEPQMAITNVSYADESREQDTGQPESLGDSECGDDEDEDEDAEVEDDGADLPPLAYARQNGLTTDYFGHNPMQSVCITPSPDQPLQSLHFTALTGHEMETAEALARDAGHERWNIDRETAEFLMSVISLARADDVDVEEDDVRMSDLKIDEPVLSSDPELDVSRLRARNTVRLSTKGMQPYALDKEKGESLAWSSEDLKLRSTVEMSIVSAGLPIDQETAKVLKEAISPDELDHLEMIEQAIDADQVSILVKCFPILTLTLADS